MTSFVVADSGIFIASVLPEERTTQAQSIIHEWYSQNLTIAAPVLFRYEIISVMRKTVYRKILTTEDAVKRREDLFSQPVQLLIDDILLRRAFELATQLNRPSAYDSQYLAVAERLGCEFWTADERLYNAVMAQLNWVKWVGNFTG